MPKQLFAGRGKTEQLRPMQCRLAEAHDTGNLFLTVGLGMFAKLFERDGVQVLVMNTTDDKERPCVSFSSQPIGFGICTFQLSFADDDLGYVKCDECFDSIDEEKAFEIVQENVNKYLVD